MSDGAEISRPVPGDGPGVEMPAVTTTERASPADFARVMREKNEQAAKGSAPGRAPARAPAPQTAGTRIGEFAQALEKSQQPAVEPTDGRRRSATDGSGQQSAAADGTPQQTAATDGSALAVDDSNPSELVDSTPESAISLDDQAALEKYRAWEQGDMFPEELEGKMHELKVAGQVKYVDTRELKQGYMRGGDYRRQFTELQGQQQAIARKEQAWNQHFEAIRAPEQMLEIYERNGYGDTLEKLADLLLERRAERNRIIEGAGIGEMRRLGLRQADWNHRDVVAAMQQAEQRLIAAHNADVRQRQLDFREAQLNQSQQQTVSQQRQQEYAAQYERQIAQLRPNAFRAHGITDNAGNRQALLRHLNNVLQSQGFNGDLTRDHFMAAASDLREEIDGQRAGEQAANNQALSPQQWQAQQQRGKPLPPNRLATGGGKPLGNTGGKERGSLRDLEEMVRKSRMG